MTGDRSRPRAMTAVLLAGSEPRGWVVFTEPWSPVARAQNVSRLFLRVVDAGSIWFGDHPDQAGEPAEAALWVEGPDDADRFTELEAIRWALLLDGSIMHVGARARRRESLP